MEYNVDYFIEKYKAISEFLWITGNLRDCDSVAACALGHIKIPESEIYPSCRQQGTEGNTLCTLFEGWFRKNHPQDYNLRANPACCVTCVNDDLIGRYSKKSTPKERILDVLYQIKADQCPKVKEIIRYVAVDKDIRKETKETAELVN